MILYLMVCINSYSTKFYDFLIEHYYEVTEYKEQYSLDFLRWQFSPIKNSPYKNIILSLQKKGKIIGFFSGLPMKLSIYGKEIVVYNISFLCINNNYRLFFFLTKRLIT